VDLHLNKGMNTCFNHCFIEFELCFWIYLVVLWIC